MVSSLCERRSWDEICSRREFRGRWVALDDCRYDDGAKEPAEGTVVDVDDNLADLCGRIRQSNHRCCAILFCDGDHPASHGPTAATQH